MVRVSSKLPAWAAGIAALVFLAAGPPARAAGVIPLPSGGEGCSPAVVMLGHSAATITFSIRCSARRTRVVGLALWRYPDRRGGIVGYPGPVRVRGKGARSPRARCGLNGGTFECHTSITGAVRISGRFRVRAGTRCAGGVSVVQVTSPRCRRGICAGDPRLTQPARGRPRGCGA